MFLPGESHRRRSLAGCSPQGHTELDTTESAEHTCPVPSAWVSTMDTGVAIGAEARFSPLSPPCREAVVQYTAHTAVHRSSGRMHQFSLITHSCLTLCDPMDCSLPGSSVYGILQARILEWVAISFFRGSSRPRDRTQVSCIAGRCFNL